jgi:hypothetical protein
LRAVSGASLSGGESVTVFPGRSLGAPDAAAPVTAAAVTTLDRMSRRDVAPPVRPRRAERRQGFIYHDVSSFELNTIVVYPRTRFRNASILAVADFDRSFGEQRTALRATPWAAAWRGSMTSMPSISRAADIPARVI